MIIWGIDPGKEGAIVILGPEMKPEKFLLSNIEFLDFVRLMARYNIDHIFLEKAQSMPKQGVVSMFNYGIGQGRLIGWIEALSIPYTLIAPKTWTKEMHVGCTGKDSKTKSAQAARRLFPQVDTKLGNKTNHKGVIDALLIAEYGRRRMFHETIKDC